MHLFKSVVYLDQETSQTEMFSLNVELVDKLCLLMEPQQATIRRIAQKTSQLISKCIDSLQELYDTFDLSFSIEKDYLHKVITTLVSPVVINAQAALFEDNIRKFPFYLRPKLPVETPAEGKNNIAKTRDEELRELQKARKRDIQKAMEKRHLLRIQTEKQAHNGQVLKEQKEQKKEEISFQNSCILSIPQRGNNTKNDLATGLDFKSERSIVNWLKLMNKEGNKLTPNDVINKATEFWCNSQTGPNINWLRAFIARYPELKQIVGKDKIEQNIGVEHPKI